MTSLPSISSQPGSLDYIPELEELIGHIERDDIRSVKEILRGDPRAVNWFHKTKKTTPLITAIKQENIEIIKLLIAEGANVEKCGGGKFMESPLFHAMRSKNNKVFDLLLEKCDVNIRIGERLFSALHEAVETVNEDAISRLIRHPHIDLNIQDQDLNTPLHIAVEKDLPNIVLTLTEGPHRIDFKMQNKNGLTAAMVNTAGNEQTGNLVKLLEQGNRLGPSRRQPAETDDAKQPCGSTSQQQEDSPPVSPDHTINNTPFSFVPECNGGTQDDEDATDLRVPPVVEDVQHNDNANARHAGYNGSPDNLRSINKDSLPPFCYASVSPVQDTLVSIGDGSFLDGSQHGSPVPADHTFPRSRFADQSDSIYLPSGGYALAERTGMGSIPVHTSPPDDREVVIPDDDNVSRRVGALELSTEEVRDECPTPECLLQRKCQGGNASASNQSTATPARGPTIKDLKYNHIKRLGDYLDPPSGVGNYRELGLSIFRGNQELVDHVNRLYLNHVGGGSPGAALLSYLQIQGCTPRQFIDVARLHKRNDVVGCFRGLSDEQLDEDFDGLHPSIVTRIGNLLELNEPGIPNWEDFAYSCGCSEQEIGEFATAVVANLMNSPTEALITLVKTNLPLHKLSDLKSHLSTIGRKDVVCYLDDALPNSVS